MKQPQAPRLLGGTLTAQGQGSTPGQSSDSTTTATGFAPAPPAPAPPPPPPRAPAPPPRAVTRTTASSLASGAPTRGSGASAQPKPAPGFGKAFDDTSIGVEIELGGLIVALPENATRTFAYVKLVDTDEPLVQVTKDMSIGSYGNPAKLDQVKDNAGWRSHTLRAS